MCHVLLYEFLLGIFYKCLNQQNTDYEYTNIHHATIFDYLARKHQLFVAIPRTSITKCSYREPTEIIRFPGSDGPNTL